MSGICPKHMNRAIVIPKSAKCVYKCEIVKYVGMIEIGNFIFVTSARYFLIHPAPPVIISDMKNQGRNPATSHRKKGYPAIGFPLLRPTENPNQKTNKVIDGFITAHAHPRAAPL